MQKGETLVGKDLKQVEAWLSELGFPTHYGAFLLDGFIVSNSELC